MYGEWAWYGIIFGLAVIIGVIHSHIDDRKAGRMPGDEWRDGKRQPPEGE